mmetsp:Transcript_133463/g.333159  ORF Transcript_133463/g.333159 Transcript_133463/m.333159 type:complete len:338 (+) Transcript_133463:93-1106(+)
MGQKSSCCSSGGQHVGELLSLAGGSSPARTAEATGGRIQDFKKQDSEGLSLCCLILLTPVLLILSPLLILEAIILFFFDVALPPLYWGCVNTTPITGTFNMDEMPPQKDVSPELIAKSDPTTAGCCCCSKTFRVAQGDTAEMVKTTCEMMIEANTVSTTWACPEDLTGVFWMKDNSVPEDLACLSFSVDTNVDGAIATTRPNGYYGWTYLNSCLGKIMSPFDGNMGTQGMNYFVFETEKLDWGRVYGCTGYDYGKLSGLYRMGKWTMERLPGEGVSWKRGCYWFPAWFGERLEMGSYTLTQIMTTRGTPVQPAYDEFVTYMGTKNKGLGMMLYSPAK